MLAQSLFDPAFVGTSTTVSIYDFIDTFDSDDWTKNDAGIWSVSGGVLTLTMKNDGSNDASVIDPIGVDVSDTLWSLDWDYKITEQDNEVIFCFGMSSLNQATDSATAQDFYGMRNDVAISGLTGALDVDGVAPLPSAAMDDSETFTHTTDTQFFYRLRRLTSTTGDLRRYTDISRTSPTKTFSSTLASTNDTHRFIKSMNRIVAAGTQDVVDLDNVGFKDGADLG